MADLRGHRGLIVWQRAMDLVPDVYQFIKRFPKEERFGLSDQLRRAVISIAANIAEGHGRNGNKEFAHFLGISQGSTSEVDTLIESALRLKYVGQEDAQRLLEKVSDIRRLLFGLMTSLKNS